MHPNERHPMRIRQQLSRWLTLPPEAPLTYLTP